jgi:hypothetical protein
MYVQRLCHSQQRLGERRAREEKSYCKSTLGQKFGDTVCLGYITHFTSTDHGEGKFRESSFVHEPFSFNFGPFPGPSSLCLLFFSACPSLLRFHFSLGSFKFKTFLHVMLESTLPSMPPTVHCTRLNIGVLLNANCEMYKYRYFVN